MVAAFALLAVGIAPAPAARAHPLAPSLFDVRDLGSGRVEVFWKTPLLRAPGVALRPELPEVCAPLGEPVTGGDATSATLRWMVDCGEAGLVGRTFRVVGLDESRTEVVLRVELRDGRSVRALLRSDAPAFEVPERTSQLRISGEYAALGMRHILQGFDHLLFVLGLVLLVSGVRALVWTVTAFTIGHSLTLSLAALGFVDFPTRVVELAIAGTILVLAVELARPSGAPPTRLRRWPAAMAGVFGLLHGLGFAGALAEAGLPAGEIPLALLSFNIGIEVGQLAFVAVVVLARSALRHFVPFGPAWSAQLPAYAIGSLAAFWCFERAAVLF